MKNIFLTLLIVTSNIVLSQTVIPKEYSKIKFVYEQKSSLIIADNTVYADTLLLKIEFPKLLFALVVNPQDSVKTIGSIALENFKTEDRKKLIDQLYHNTHSINGEYDVKKNKTILYFKRGNPALSKIFNDKLSTNMDAFTFKIIVDYNKKTINRIYPRVNYDNPFSTELKQIKFMDTDPLIGTFIQKILNGIQTNVVELNNLHDAKVSTDVLFSNANYGVGKIISLYDITTLLSVTYE